VREARAALQAASAGRFHRLVLGRGLPGSFRHAARVINAAIQHMQHQAKVLAHQQAEISQSAAVFSQSSQALRSTNEAAMVEAGRTASWPTSRRRLLRPSKNRQPRPTR
jgi:hypothetical protein